MNSKIVRTDSSLAAAAPIQELLLERVQNDPRFAAELLQDAVECLLHNDVITAQLLLRDITNSTIGFPALARKTGIMEKSLMRMLSAKGNPQAKNLFQIIQALQQLNELKLEVRAV